MLEGVDDESLRRLCARYGIATAYDDVWGARHDVSREALTALLRDAGATLPEDAAATERAAWRDALPPVQVVAAGAGGFSVALRLPADTAHFTWRLVEENGTAHEGVEQTAALQALERADVDGVPRVRYRLEIRLPLTPGYHRLGIVDRPGPNSETLIVCAPPHCHRPPALEAGGRLWGLTLQLHSLRSHRNWGIGDFTDLAAFTAQAAREGAGVIGLNPLHALFPHNPAHASPYSPSSRAHLNTLYIDVEAVPDFLDCAPARARVNSPVFQARLAALRDEQRIDHVGVAAAKHEVMELLHQRFRRRGVDDAEVHALERFRERGGEAARQHAVFEALQEHFHHLDPSVWGWPAWPAAYQDLGSPQVASFAEKHAERVGYFEYLQWQAARQLEAVGRQCDALGMPVGLYLDLAVSVDRGGADAWRHRSSFALGARVGAPPDVFNPNGQDWGLPPLAPDRLRESRYAVFIEALRANMRGAGAIRIDHVMMLMRLFWIPSGGTGRDGSYVHYPYEELLSILALESERHRCLVIGEDLGTVPDAMRDAMRRFGVLSYRLLYFERESDGAFRAPGAYPRDAVVAVSTHDLATLAGWWSVHDLRARFALGLFPDATTFEQQVLERAQEKVRLLRTVQQQVELSPESLATAAGGAGLDAEAVAAMHAFLAGAPSSILMAQLEDALGEIEQANLPGTTDQHPNWRRKYGQGLEDMWRGAIVRKLCETLARSRPRPSVGGPPARQKDTLIPRATYRLQLHSGFGFDDAARILPYLSRLGISHVYCSPIQRARPGSMHGYDVVAHSEINPELGGMPAFGRFTTALKQHGMGQLIDLVPNHMGVLGADNMWWMDVLENGTASLYAEHFDIEWRPRTPGLAGKVLLPVLGDHYGQVLDSGDLKLQWQAEKGEFWLHYHEHHFPLGPGTYPAVLERAAIYLNEPEESSLLASIATAFGHLPGAGELTAQAMAERARDKEVLKSRLARLAGRHTSITQAIGFAVQAFHRPGARDALHALLEAQAWRLAHWRVAADEINYRRFFDINELAALRMEREAVFDATHALPLELAASGWVDGLRIDHPDGLQDPARYFERLQDGFALRSGTGRRLPDAAGRPSRPLYVVAEKIAAPGEDVPVDWALHGTTGYRFANVANGVLVDPRAAGRLERIWRDFSGVTESFREIVHAARCDAARGTLASDLEVLAIALLDIAKAHRKTRDHSLHTLRDVLATVVASFTVYRTYNADEPAPQDVRYVDEAIAAARERMRLADATVFDFVRDALLGRAPDDADAPMRQRVLRFAKRFQQFSAPVAAKGVEDTAFYRYFPLSSLNEVGGDPDRIGMTVAEFHEASSDRQHRWPHTMLATSTHDNKRSEDVRLRIDVLSELPAPWRLALRRWRAMNAGVRGATSPAHEYLLYQTLLGTFEPDAAHDEAYAERIVVYMRKAAREGKRHTSWTQPDAAYERALEGFVRGILRPGDTNRFLPDLRRCAAELAWYGALNGLSLILLKYTSPGVPDLYQGCELIDHSLVDPDNRRPVDYEKRARWLDELSALGSSITTELDETVREFARAPETGRAKLWLGWRLLSLRKLMPELFRDGSYEPLEVRGPRAGHIVAFMRREGDRVLVAIAVRLFATLARESGQGPEARTLPLGEGIWRDTRVLLPDGIRVNSLEDCITGTRCVLHGNAIPVGQALRMFPGAVLVSG
jgi:(1->4)-alpha-D-glucan 1-alpha-D-glucosylmutase